MKNYIKELDITLLKFYRNSDVMARKYLAEMGDDVNKVIHENYATPKMRDEKIIIFVILMYLKNQGFYDDPSKAVCRLSV